MLRCAPHRSRGSRPAAAPRPLVCARWGAAAPPARRPAARAARRPPRGAPRLPGPRWAPAGPRWAPSRAAWGLPSSPPYPLRLCAAGPAGLRPSARRLRRRRRALLRTPRPAAPGPPPLRSSAPARRARARASCAALPRSPARPRARCRAPSALAAAAPPPCPRSAAAFRWSALLLLGRGFGPPPAARRPAGGLLVPSGLTPAGAPPRPPARPCGPLFPPPGAGAWLCSPGPARAALRLSGAARDCCGTAWGVLRPAGRALPPCRAFFSPAAAALFGASALFVGLCLPSALLGFAAAPRSLARCLLPCAPPPRRPSWGLRGARGLLGKGPAGPRRGAAFRGPLRRPPRGFSGHRCAIFGAVDSPKTVNRAYTLRVSASRRPSHCRRRVKGTPSARSAPLTRQRRDFCPAGLDFPGSVRYTVLAWLAPLLRGPPLAGCPRAVKMPLGL